MRISFIQKMCALWKEFLPLSVSDVTMALGDPLVNTTLAHLPRTQENFAALGIVKSLVVLFESPIIMMLHASNALSGKKEAREALWRFVLLASLILTVLLFILFIPFIFFTISEHFIGISKELSITAHRVLLCLLLWPAAIAIRRYFQGILIIHGRLKIIAHAGFLRLAVLFICLVTGYFLGINSSYLAGGSIMVSIVSETVVVFIAANRYKNSFFDKNPKSNDSFNPKSIKEIWNYYWPLAHSMVLVWGGRALLIVCLARSIDSNLALAVWPATWALVLVFANSTRMVQQVIIRNKDKYHPADFIIFALSVGFSLSAILLFFSLSISGENLLKLFVGQDPLLLEGTKQVLLICFSVPIFIAVQNVLQGFLMCLNKTKAINRATLAGTGTLLIFAFTGIYFNFLGANVAAFSMVSALVLEILILITQVPWKHYINIYSQHQTLYNKVI